MSFAGPRPLAVLALTALTAAPALGSAAPAAATAPAAPAAPAVPAGPAGAQRAPRSLEILLTNDDGFAAPGLAAVRQALTAAGHRVTVVAPATDQSGKGAGMTATLGARLAARQESPGVWSVGGTPADSVLFGLAVVFQGRRPDLVVSGTNFGQNTGALVNHSGTVGAAVTGLEQKVPSIAVSTEYDPAAGPAATAAAFPATARYLADLVAKLAKAAGRGAVLPPGVALNVNYPITSGAPKGTRLTRVGRTAFFALTYTPAGDGSYVIGGRTDTTPEPVRNADTTALAADQISVTLLDGDWSHPAAAFSLPR
ncbi:5'/3'-nucleotidase SurE [Actinomadura hibisca]|uniref:5'/3'-nucleotidase SurE n=1 Tax=Actinomadura hibisca TaxID=68565 RepID=UPI0008364E4C|nr:5'/3'-nucleotidase SurE [Actinomadura hibisca]